METESAPQKKHWYDRYYKLILVFPVLLLILCLIYLGWFYHTTGDFMIRDTSLAGGTSITLQGAYDVQKTQAELSALIPDVRVRAISDSATARTIALVIESGEKPDQVKDAVEQVLDITLDAKNSNIEFSGPALGQSFYKQLIYALIASFILMSIVIFFLFRTFIPSIAVIFAAFADIVMPLALINLLGIPLSAAGISAFLMLIGYSVDTDILLTTRVTKKREGTVNQRIYSSFRTGIFMTLASLCAVLPAFFIVTGLPDSFRQIFLILTFGLVADIITTWLTNASILKWYAEAKHL